MNKFTLLEKRKLILDYLNKSFKAEVEISNFLYSTIYYLKFENIRIGIMLENDMIIDNDIDYLYNYSYDLVYDELIKITEQKYVNWKGG